MITYSGAKRSLHRKVRSVGSLSKTSRGSFTLQPPSTSREEEYDRVTGKMVDPIKSVDTGTFPSHDQSPVGESAV